MMLLRRADSLVPMISMIVSTATMNTAGRLKSACAVVPSASFTSVPGGAVRVAGMVMPTFSSRLSAYLPQPTATVAAPIAYSRMRSQPMIQAKISPSVAEV